MKNYKCYSLFEKRNANFFLIKEQPKHFIRILYFPFLDFGKRPSLKHISYVFYIQREQRFSTFDHCYGDGVHVLSRTYVLLYPTKKLRDYRILAKLLLAHSFINKFIISFLYVVISCPCFLQEVF